MDKAEAKKIARDTAANVTAAEAKKAEKDAKADKRSGGGDVAGKHAAQWHHHHHADPNRASKVKAKEDAEKDIKDDEAAKEDFEGKDVSEVLGGGTARKEPSSVASLVQGKCAGWCGEKLSKCKGWVSGERAKGEHEYTMAECREGTEEKICMSAAAGAQGGPRYASHSRHGAGQPGAARVHGSPGTARGPSCCGTRGRSALGHGLSSGADGGSRTPLRPSAPSLPRPDCHPFPPCAAR